MSKRKRDLYDRITELQSVGWEIDYSKEVNKIQPHTGKTTMRHFQVKAGICNILSNEKHAFVTECNHPERGIADVLDVNENGEKAFVYEVETDADRDKRVEKALQYTDDANCLVVQECYIIDPTEAPESIDDLESWLYDRVPSV